MTVNRTMKEKNSNLSLIIPCYNEQDNLPLLFKKLLEIQAKFNEIILVDNGSTDNITVVVVFLKPIEDILQRIRTEYHHLKN